MNSSEQPKHSLTKYEKSNKKITIYEALRTLAKNNKLLKKKIPADFATNDKYLYTYP